MNYICSLCYLLQTQYCIYNIISKHLEVNTKLQFHITMEEHVDVKAMAWLAVSCCKIISQRFIGKPQSPNLLVYVQIARKDYCSLCVKATVTRHPKDNVFQYLVTLIPINESFKI